LQRRAGRAFLIWAEAETEEKDLANFSKTNQVLLESKFTSALRAIAAKRKAPPDAGREHIHPPVLQEVHHDCIKFR
jgi:hypothetical protein